MRRVGAETLADLRMIASTDLLRAMDGNAASFGLRPNVDGHVLPHDLPETIAAHQGNGAALMIGANYNEGTVLFRRRGPKAWRRRSGGASAPRATRSPSSTAGPTTTAPPPRRTVCRATICSPRLRARRWPSRNREKPAYVYRFTRFAPGSDPIKVGAFHSAELAYVFGTQASIDRPWSDRDRALSEQMRAILDEFRQDRRSERRWIAGVAALRGAGAGRHGTGRRDAADTGAGP